MTGTVRPSAHLIEKLCNRCKFTALAISFEIVDPRGVGVPHHLEEGKALRPSGQACLENALACFGTETNRVQAQHAVSLQASQLVSGAGTQSRIEDVHFTQRGQRVPLLLKACLAIRADAPHCTMFLPQVSAMMLPLGTVAAFAARVRDRTRILHALQRPRQR